MKSMLNPWVDNALHLGDEQTVDYNTIRFQFSFDDLNKHVGIFSHYRRSVDSPVEAEILEKGKDFLGLIINLSGHSHRYRIGTEDDTLPRGHYNFFFIPADSSRWQMDPGTNSIWFLQCGAGFLRQFTEDVPLLEPFLTDAVMRKGATLTKNHLAATPEILDHIFDLMREHQFTGKSRESYLRAKSGNMVLAALMNSHVRSAPVLDEAEAGELRRLYQYMVDNLQYLVDTRPLMNLVKMPDEAMKTKFKAQFGKSMIEALRYERLKKAENLLVDTLIAIGDIAEMVGYGSASSFTYAFTSQYGVYPTEFRRRYSGLSRDS